MDQDNFWSEATGMPPFSNRDSPPSGKNVAAALAAFLFLPIWFFSVGPTDSLMHAWFDHPTHCRTVTGMEARRFLPDTPIIGDWKETSRDHINWDSEPIEWRWWGPWYMAYRDYDAVCQRSFGSEYEAHDMFAAVH